MQRRDINLPQLLMIAAGLLLAVLAMVLRRVDARRRMHGCCSDSHLLAVLAISGLTWIVLELVLAAMQLPMYFPAEIPDSNLTEASWWTCDAAGCHYVYDLVTESCADGLLFDRHCIVNRQGYADTQDFVPSDELEEKKRILFLGDSYTQGFSAEIGRSYVETVERMLAKSVVWNFGIAGTGTRQALASLRAFGPTMQPQVVVLGFYMNDFEENVLPMDIWARVVTAEGRPGMVRKYKLDQWGNAVMLELETVWHYRRQGIYPPRNNLELFVGSTRLGSLVLRLRDKIAEQFSGGDHFDKQISFTRGYLTQLISEVSSLGAKLIVLLIPEPNELDAMNPRYLEAIQLVTELQIPYINPIDKLQAGIDYATGNDFHWNTVGHQKIGALLGECLRAYFDDETFANCENVVLP